MLDKSGNIASNDDESWCCGVLKVGEHWLKVPQVGEDLMNFGAKHGEWVK